MEIAKHFTTKRPTDEEIAALEQLVHGTLPEDYRSFMQRENGGKPVAACFDIKNDRGSEGGSAVRYIFSLHDPAAAAVPKSTEFFTDLIRHIKVYEGRIPWGFLPIAADVCDNLILLKVGGVVGRGEVYFWDHEREDETMSRKNMTLLAPSFSAFVEMLETEPV